MAQGNSQTELKRANFRRCILCTWPNYTGLGFNLQNFSTPPHIIRTVESNSPAAAAGLKILDAILSVNGQDVSNADYQIVTQAIKNARDTQNKIDLLVIEKRFYDTLVSRGVVFDPQYANVHETPLTMPKEYTSFPKYTPRTCDISLKKDEESFGFEIVNGIGDIGVYIQEVHRNSPASRTALRKCDRLLEINGKFVNAEPSKNIIEKLAAARKKRTVKLYVVDTFTYKYFQENSIPLPSKEYLKSSFSKQLKQQEQEQEQQAYINIKDVPNEEPRSPEMESSGPFFPQIPNYQNLSNYQDNIRLYTIHRANATETYGIELNYHRREQYHSLKITSNREPVLGQIEADNRLIEVNGENIEGMNDDNVRQLIRATKFPQPLQLLVADGTTYNHYKQQGKTIHHRLPTVKRIPEELEVNNQQRKTSSISTTRTPTLSTTPRQTSRTITGISNLVNNVPIEPIVPDDQLQANIRRYELHHLPNFVGYGFSVNSSGIGIVSHKINRIAPNSPAEQQGLRAGDYIISVNDQNVQRIIGAQFNTVLRSAAKTSDEQGNPLVLEVINEAFYDPSNTRTPTISTERKDTKLDLPIQQPPQSSLIANEIVERNSTISQQTPIVSRANTRTPTINRPNITPSQRNPSPRDSSIYVPNESPSYSKPPQRQDSQTYTIIKPDLTPSNHNRQMPVRDEITPSSKARQSNVSPYASQRSLTTPKSTNGLYSAVHQQHSPIEQRSHQLSPSSLFHSRENLSRGAIDMVSGQRLLRYCRLTTEMNQSFGFELYSNENKHFARNIQKNSPAQRGGLNENDCLVEIDYENVENRSKEDVLKLIHTARQNGILRLFVSPHDIKVLSQRSAKSMTSLNNSRHYNDTNQSRYQDSSLSSRNRSIPRHYNSEISRSRPHLSNIANNYTTEPSAPLPRRCLLQYDPSFRGCGFHIMERDNYDTPIIADIMPNSPAKRSGLTEGDHIIYIDSQNVQGLGTFNDVTSLIHRHFEQNGYVTLTTLTGPAYNVLKRRGGYLDSHFFDYQSRSTEHLRPRLYQLQLSAYDRDFGFTLQYHDFFYIKTIDEQSSAYSAGLRKNDIILEINGRVTKQLSIYQIDDIIEMSKRSGRLDLLTIDFDGYQYSNKHAIPLNSLLPFVQVVNGQRITPTQRLQYEPVYL